MAYVSNSGHPHHDGGRCNGRGNHLPSDDGPLVDDLRRPWRRSKEWRQWAIVGIVGLLVVAILLPLAAILVRAAISRAREYQADATGAQHCKNPWALANALEKLETETHRTPMKVNEPVSHLFIANLLSGFSATMFSTHPPMKERISRLREMRCY
jgi:Zn-dependent protease with chaperone function